MQENMNDDILAVNNNNQNQIIKKKKNKKETTLRFANVNNENVLNQITDIIDLLLKEDAKLNIKVCIDENSDLNEIEKNKEVLNEMNQFIEKCMN